MNAKRILIVEDDVAIRFGMRDFLEAKGFEVSEADTCASACERFASARPDVVLIDYRLDDGTALDLMPRLREIDTHVPLLVLTGHGSIDLAVQAIKLGAEQFLTKPVELPALLVMLQRLLDVGRVRRSHAARKARDNRCPVDPFLGHSPAIQALAAQARKIVGTESPILIQGETGTGKSLLAAWLHANGPRADEALVDLNCAGLVREFLETELFGHEKGAFTGATAAKPGLLELAHDGTVFLDEIGDVDPLVQPKLLKVLEEKRFRRLGDVRDRVVDVSLIAATHQDLAASVREGRFRSDLYFRISTIPLRIPPLRERVLDIPVLAASLLRGITVRVDRPEVTLSERSLMAMQRYAWPGNIRELRNVLERAALLCDDGVIEPGDLRFEPPGALAPPTAHADPTDLTLKQVERCHIERVLLEEEGKVESAAKRLGIPRSSLYQKLKLYGMNGSGI